jgi:hypothetical protein
MFKLLSKPKLNTGISSLTHRELNFAELSMLEDMSKKDQELEMITKRIAVFGRISDPDGNLYDVSIVSPYDISYKNANVLFCRYMSYHGHSYKMLAKYKDFEETANLYTHSVIPRDLSVYITLDEIFNSKSIMASFKIKNLLSKSDFKCTLTIYLGKEIKLEL